MPRKQRFKPSRKPKPIGTPTDLSTIDVSTLPPLIEPSSPIPCATPRESEAAGLAVGSGGVRVTGAAAVIDDFGGDIR